MSRDKLNIPERPTWIRGKASFNDRARRLEKVLRDLNLKTVCTQAVCPNKCECWGNGHATFIILGDACTRNCLFCNISNKATSLPDPSEPKNIAQAVKKLGLKSVVITSVTRDDLKNLGTGQFIQTVSEIKNTDPDIEVELLIPDLNANESLLKKIVFSGAQIIGHNMEMPERLYKEIRPRSDYHRSLTVLRTLSELRNENKIDILVKSSMMIGLGEDEDDIIRTFDDIRTAGTDIMYIGQYLSPTKDHWPVKKYYDPVDFEYLKEKALEMGFKEVCSAPMVRSSYRVGARCTSCEL